MARQTKSQRMRLFSELLEDRLTPAKMLGLTPGNSLLQFDSATPGTTTSIAISNLNAGETVLGIDFRPADGKLYAVTDANRLLTINHQTGAATLVGPLTADPTDATSPFTALDSGVLGFDFNPVADRLRIVTNAGSNLRINPANALVITDGAVNPAGFSIGASAYTNNFAGATATTLFNLDITGDRLTIQNPPNNGTLSVVGTTLGAGIAVANSSGFDIVTTGGPTVTNTAFAVLTQGGDATLFTVDLSTGTATSQGVIGSGAALNGLAAVPAGTFQFSASNFTINEQGGFATITVTRTGGSDGTVVLDLTTTGLTATAGADFATLGTLPMVFSDGDTSLSVSVNIFDDLVPESVETVRLSLAANSANALIGPGGTAFLNIRDNETPPALMYAVDSNNKSILTFDAADPGTILNNAAISNVISSDIVSGVDIRPANGEVFILVRNGSAGTIRTIDPVTGTSTIIASLAADPADATNPFTGLTGDDFGFDFNPTNDRIRIVSDAGQNLLVNPANGFVTTQTDLNPGTPVVVGSAYTNSFAGATNTTLFAVDAKTDQVFIQNPPGNGTLALVGSIGVNVIDNVGFEIRAFGNEGFAAMVPAGKTRSELFAINLATGAATPLGVIGTGFIINGLTSAPIVPPAPPPNLAPTISDIANQNGSGPFGPVGFTVDDANDPEASLSLTATSDNPALVPSGNVTFGGNGANRTVFVNAVPGQSGTATITVTVTDPGGLTDTDTFTVTVPTPPANTNPTISDIPNFTVQSGSKVGPVAFTIGDIETPSGQLQLTASSANTTLIPDANISFGTVSGQRTILVLTPSGQTGTATITVTVTDAGGLTATDTFDVTLTPPPPPPPPVNNPPQISDVTDTTALFGGFTSLIPFFVSDVETAAGNLTVAASSSNTAVVANKGIILGGSGSNRNVVVSPNAGQSGTSTITITVTDAGGQSASDSFLVSIAAPAPLPAAPAGVTVHEAAGANPAAIQASVDAFRALLGTNNGVGGSFASGRREINWDAVPEAKENPFPGDFFNVNSKRGVLLSTNGTGLAVSGAVGTPGFEFANVTAQQWGPVEFSSFSSPKLFAPLGSTTYDVEFRLPGTDIPAGVRAFGVVFTDADLANVSKMEFFDAAGNLLITRDVLPTGVKNEGLSFLGIQLPAGQLAAKVRVHTGTNPIDTEFRFPPPDGVAVDDFIYSEPVPLPPDQVTDLFAVGSGPGVESQVNVFNNDGSLRFALIPFPNFTGGVTVSTGDVNGDGTDDIAVGAGAGGGPHVKVFDGQTGAEIRSFFAYDAGFKGGVFVGLGDVNRDGRADIVTGAGAGGGPHVQVFHGVTGAVLHSFFAYEPTFSGGVSVRAGDVNADGFADVITGAGPGGGPIIRAFSGIDLSLLQNFFAGDPDSRDGVLVGTANFNAANPNFEIIGSVRGRIGVFGITDGTSNYIEQENFVAFNSGLRAAPAAIRLENGSIAILIGASPTPGVFSIVGQKVKIVNGQGTSALTFDAFDDAFLNGVSVG